MKFLMYMKKLILILVVVVLPIWLFFSAYSFIFKIRIVGEVQAVESVGVQALVATQKTEINPQVFSMSIAVKDLSSNEIHMASTEDRQWAAVQKGNCVVAAFFPYEPWKITKAGTFHRARLLKNYMSCADVPQDIKELNWWGKIRFFLLM